MISEVQVELSPTIELVMPLVIELKEKLKLTQISTSTIHLVLKEGMELVEKLNIPGSQKQDTVIAIVKAVVQDLVENEEEEKLILSLIDNKVLENTMNLIVLASKGELNLNSKKTHKKLFTVFKTCIPLTMYGILYLVKSCNPKRKHELAQEPTTQEPATQEPATQEPATQESATQEPATQEPATQEPALEAV